MPLSESAVWISTDLTGKAKPSFAQARQASNARLNPRFPQPSVGGTEEKTVPMFGDAVSGEKEPDVSSLMGGGTPGTTTR